MILFVLAMISFVLAIISFVLAMISLVLGMNPFEPNRSSVGVGMISSGLATSPVVQARNPFICDRKHFLSVMEPIVMAGSSFGSAIRAFICAMSRDMLANISLTVAIA